MLDSQCVDVDELCFSNTNEGGNGYIIVKKAVMALYFFPFCAIG